MAQQGVAVNSVLCVLLLGHRAQRLTYLTCEQLGGVPAAYRAGHPYGDPGPLVAAQPSIPAAEQHSYCVYQGLSRQTGSAAEVLIIRPQLYAALVAGTCVAALLCFSLPGASFILASYCSDAPLTPRVVC